MKPGEKYILEIERTAKTPNGEIAFIKGFNTLVFDQYGLDKLRPAEKIGDAYRRGFDDACKTSPNALPHSVIDSAYKRGWNECAEKIQHIKSAAYQNGLDDAWKLARRVCMRPSDGGMSAEDLEKAFGSLVLPTIFHVYGSYSKAFQKIKAFEQEKSEIHVGDEVCIDGKKETFVVTNIGSAGASEDRFYSGIKQDGLSMGCRGNMLVKTGRHVDVSAILGHSGSKDVGAGAPDDPKL